MAKQITLNEQQVKKIIDLYESSSRRFDKAIEQNSNRIDEYRAEVLTIEQILEIIGMEWC